MSGLATESYYPMIFAASLKKIIIYQNFVQYSAQVLNIYLLNKTDINIGNSIAIPLMVAM